MTHVDILGTRVQARQAARAAGGHPLQQSLRAASAALLRKYGAGGSRAGAEEGREESEEGEEEEGEEAEEELGSEGVRASADSEGEEGDGEEEELETEEEEEEEDGLGGEDVNPKGPTLQARRASGAKATSSSAAAVAPNPNKTSTAGDPVAALPFTLALPGSYEEFAGLVAGRPAAELREAVARIRACNAAALMAGGRRRLQVHFFWHAAVSNYDSNPLLEGWAAWLCYEEEAVSQVHAGRKAAARIGGGPAAARMASSFLSPPHVHVPPQSLGCYVPM